MVGSHHQAPKSSTPTPGYPKRRRDAIGTSIQHIVSLLEGSMSTMVTGEQRKQNPYDIPGNTGCLIGILIILFIMIPTCFGLCIILLGFATLRCLEKVTQTYYPKLCCFFMVMTPMVKSKNHFKQIKVD